MKVQSTSGHNVRIAFDVWARIWSAAFAVVFVGVTALTISLWVTDPEYTETTPVSDLSFFALGAIIGLGFVSQLRTPEHNIAGVQQAIIGILSLGVAGLIGDRIEPLVGSLLFLVAAAILLALHPVEPVRSCFGERLLGSLPQSRLIVRRCWSTRQHWRSLGSSLARSSGSSTST